MGWKKKHMNKNNTREALRLLFNLLLIMQKQPRSWKQNNINPKTRQGPKQNRKSVTAYNQPSSVSNVLGNHGPKAKDLHNFLSKTKRICA
jgi:hypothetical protein